MNYTTRSFRPSRVMTNLMICWPVGNSFEMHLRKEGLKIRHPILGQGGQTGGFFLGKGFCTVGCLLFSLGKNREKWRSAVEENCLTTGTPVWLTAPSPMGEGGFVDTCFRKPGLDGTILRGSKSQSIRSLEFHFEGRPRRDDTQDEAGAQHQACRQGSQGPPEEMTV